MHLRHEHAEFDIPTLQKFVRTYPLGQFTTSLPHPSHPTLQISHIPFILDSEPGSGVLRGHIARINPQSKVLIDTLRQRPAVNGDAGSSGSPGNTEIDEEVLVMFNAPVNAYVTPRFYTTTKPATGKVVPTWDYAAVQAYGKLKVYHSATRETDEFIHRQMGDLNAWGEETVPGQKWGLDDAPADYLAARRKAVIGLEIRITRLEGRFKLSQERDQGDRSGVISGFKGLGTEDGRVMAEMIEEKGKGLP